MADTPRAVRLTGLDETRAEVAALKADAQALKTLLEVTNKELAQLDQNLAKLRKVLGGQTSVSDAPQ